MKDKRLEFNGLIDFYEKKDTIKELYDELSYEEIVQYKMYVYSRPFEEENVKDLMWEYINGYEESQFELGKKYRIKKHKFDKRRKDEFLHTFKIRQLE